MQGEPDPRNERDWYREQNAKYKAEAKRLWADLDRLQAERDRLREIAAEAIDALDLEEGITDSQFGIGAPGEDYHEKSKALRSRHEAVGVGEGRASAR
jgi:hypothetical protein